MAQRGREMIPGRIAGATRVLGVPTGWDKDRDGPCGGLPVRDGVTGMESAWFPTSEEIAAIVAGAPVILEIVGRGHPPVMLSVGEKPE
jgi:hypothetical protein